MSTLLHSTASSPTKLRSERGFTLIELLVVMIIIGVLAAIAIPIFLNQQKTARDSATTSDVKNIATAVHTALTQNPDANNFSLSDLGNGKVRIRTADWVSGVGSTNFKYEDANVTKGTRIAIFTSSTAVTANAQKGAYAVCAYNPDGKVYVDVSSCLLYDPLREGLVGKQQAGNVPSGAVWVVVS